jgi:hypothetical protein
VKEKILKTPKNSSKTPKKRIKTHFEHFWKKKILSDFFGIFGPQRASQISQFACFWTSK